MKAGDKIRVSDRHYSRHVRGKTGVVLEVVDPPGVVRCRLDDFDVGHGRFRDEWAVTINNLEAA